MTRGSWSREIFYDGTCRGKIIRALSREIDTRRIRGLVISLWLKHKGCVATSVATAATGETQKFTPRQARKNAARLLLFSCRSLAKFCGRICWRAITRRGKRELASRRDAFRANSPERQVVSVPDVRRCHSVELLHFDLGLITAKFPSLLSWRGNRDNPAGEKFTRKVARRLEETLDVSRGTRVANMLKMPWDSECNLIWRLIDGDDEFLQISSSTSICVTSKSNVL